MQAEQAEAQHAGDSSEAEDWRHKLHHYLNQLFQKDQTAGADYHSLQVTLSPAVRTLACQHRLYVHCSVTITVTNTRWGSIIITVSKTRWGEYPGTSEPVVHAACTAGMVFAYNTCCCQH